MATSPSPSPSIDATHDPALRSWVESANDPASDFPIQNLALCAFEKAHHGHSHGHLGVRIGDQILDVGMLVESGQFADDEDLQTALSMPFWNAFAAHPGLWRRFRERTQRFLSADAPAGQQARRLRTKALIPAEGAPLIHPLSVFNYTDFYASKHHATTVGSMFRPDNPLLPNYVHVPIGYHGRASSVVLSGTPVKRPRGQQAPKEEGGAPTFGPCTMLDYEMELGVYVGAGNRLGEPIDIAGVGEHMLGVCIVNDWSARDLQRWEYQPLGPFLAKNFATSVSPYVVTMDALAPFRVPGPERAEGDPAPLEYLRSAEDWGLKITVEVALRSAQMREKGMAPHPVSRADFARMYWTFAQMVTHHASNGCNLQPGDLLASGTVSGPAKGERGCLLELTWDGTGPDGKPKPRTPVPLPTGETRTFLQDGDEVVMRAWCERDGFRRIGLGECRGVIV
jgi:fumarylacetoacetase